MKLSHILIASSVCMVAAFSGCGGSGTPLPAPQKVAKVTFIARTSAAQSLLGASDRISDYTVSGFITPAGLSIPVNQGDKTIIDGYLRGLTPSTLGSYSTSSLIQPATGKVYFSVLPRSTTDINGNNIITNLGFGPFADIYLVMGNQSQTKSDIVTLIAAANPVMTAKAGVATCPASSSCVIAPSISVFYNISVSVQTR